MDDDSKQLEDKEPNTLLMVIGGAAFSLLLCLGAAGYFVIQSWAPVPRARTPAVVTAPAAHRPLASSAAGTVSTGGRLADAESKGESDVVVVSPSPGMSRVVPSSKKITRRVDLSNMKSVGEVYAGWISEDLLSLEWSQLLVQSGTVAVPEGVVIKLKADWDASDISGLLKLKPSDLDMLDLSRANLNSATLAPISHLTGLRALRLEGPGINDRAIKHLQGLRLLDMLELRDCPVTDAGLEIVAGLPRLRVLHLREAKMTSAGLKKIGRIKTLTELNIVNIPVADRDLVVLANMPRLIYLRLAANGLSDKGLVWLKNLPALRRLELLRNHIHGSGLACFRGRRLAGLSLAGSEIDDAGLTGIVGVNTLYSLFLDDTAITDRSIPTLLKLPQLGALNLYQTRLTDAGALQLQGLKNLKLLNLPTQIGPAAKAKLKARLPGCKIEQGDGWPFD